jgi:hypothetical protein
VFFARQNRFAIIVQHNKLIPNKGNVFIYQKVFSIAMQHNNAMANRGNILTC